MFPNKILQKSRYSQYIKQTKVEVRYKIRDILLTSLLFPLGPRQSRVYTCSSTSFPDIILELFLQIHKQSNVIFPVIGLFTFLLWLLCGPGYEFLEIRLCIIHLCFWLAHQFSSVQFSSVTQLCLTLRPHGLQHTRTLCLSPTPAVYSKSCPSSQWCHPTISSSVIPFSSHLQSFPASGSFLFSFFLSFFFNL